MTEQNVLAVAENQATDASQATPGTKYAAPKLELLGRVRDLTAAGSKPGKENKGDIRGSKP